MRAVRDFLILSDELLSDPGVPLRVKIPVFLARWIVRRIKSRQGDL
jgi:hypothetical protein